MAGDVQNLLKLSLVQCSRGSSGEGGGEEDSITFSIFIKKKTVDLNVLISCQAKTDVKKSNYFYFVEIDI